MVKNQSTPELGNKYTIYMYLLYNLWIYIFFRSKKPNNNNASTKKEFIPVDANNIEDSKCFDSNGHSCQALIGDDGVVLDLEDCCQMTICEKVCISFEKNNSWNLF